jgi:hypothetical protein
MKNNHFNDIWTRLFRYVVMAGLFKIVHLLLTRIE